jgi:hypothetical protein
MGQQAVRAQRRRRHRVAVFWFNQLLLHGPLRMLRNLVLWLRLRPRAGEALEISVRGLELAEVPRPRELLNLCAIFLTDSESPEPVELTADFLRRVAAAFPGMELADGDFEEVRRLCLDLIDEAKAGNAGPSIVGGQRVVWWEHDPASGRIMGHVRSPAGWRLGQLGGVLTVWRRSKATA